MKVEKLPAEDVGDGKPFYRYKVTKPVEAEQTEVVSEEGLDAEERHLNEKISDAKKVITDCQTRLNEIQLIRAEIAKVK